MIHLSQPRSILLSLLYLLCCHCTMTSGKISLVTHTQEISPDDEMIPASTLKIVSAWMAWHTLGPHFTYQTSLHHCSDGHYLKLSYDPTQKYQDLKKLITPYNLKHTSLTIIPTGLLEAFHPQWLIEDTTARYSQPLAPWINQENTTHTSLQELSDKLQWQGQPLRMESQLPDNCRIVSTHRSLPLSEILSSALLHSNNLTMDSIWITMAEHLSSHPVHSWQQAALINHSWLKHTHPSLGQGIHIVDGSGLSRMNLVKPKAMLNILDEMAHDTDFFTWLRASLPQAGLNGTMKYRFTDQPHPPIVAKTGTMTGIKSLVGWVIYPNTVTPFVWFEQYIEKATPDHTILASISDDS